MNRDAIIEKIRAMKPVLAHTHIERIRLFGSAVHNEMGPDSDVDILLNFSRTPSLFDLSEIHVRLTEELGVEVDIALADGLLPEFRDRILNEAVDV